MYCIGFKQIHSEVSCKEICLSIFKLSGVNPLEFTREQIKIQEI